MPQSREEGGRSGESGRGKQAVTIEEPEGGLLGTRFFVSASDRKEKGRETSAPGLF